jgi:cyclopropane fatty-acyl-phospholipid synthase-like methyltransferase
MDPRHTVESGYDRIAEQYLATKRAGAETIVAQLEQLAAGLPDGAAVLDLGCGAGVPALEWLAQRFTVTGVDVSARQLELARQRVPAATLIKADMTALELAAESFDAVVALYSIIHVPRQEQASLLERINGWLKPGGGFLATWAIHAWEGREADWEGWGAPMWWSTFGADKNLALLDAAGFAVGSAQQLTGNGETWLWVLAYKPD